MYMTAVQHQWLSCKIGWRFFNLTLFFFVLQWRSSSGQPTILWSHSINLEQSHLKQPCRIIIIRFAQTTKIYSAVGQKRKIEKERRHPITGWSWSKPLQSHRPQKHGTKAAQIHCGWKRSCSVSSPHRCNFPICGRSQGGGWPGVHICIGKRWQSWRM